MVGLAAHFKICPSALGFILFILFFCFGQDSKLGPHLHGLSFSVFSKLKTPR